MVEDENLAALGDGESGVLDSGELSEDDGRPQKKKGKGRSVTKGKTAAKKQETQAASEASSEMQVQLLQLLQQLSRRLQAS